MHPFWNWIVQFFPKWIAPNLLTLTGFLHLVLNFAILSYYDTNFYASDRDTPDVTPIPDWVWIMCAFNIFAASTLDGIDGKQARRTGTSSPLGELFDHGLDSWASSLYPISMYSIFGRGEFSVPPFRVYLIVIGVMLGFITCHWEKYNTKILFLPWGYDFSCIAMAGVFIITYIGGYEMWKGYAPIIGLTYAQVFEIVMHAGVFIFTFPVTFWNIYRSYRDKTGKLHGAWEANRPLVSSCLFFGLMLLWSQISSCGILEQQPRMFYLVSGVVFSNIGCKLIISQMSDTRCELINTLIFPLIGIVALVSLCSLGQIEVYLLAAYSVFAVCAHLHFGMCVVQEMCDHFNISAFTIRRKTS
ncbi:hypothetical protein FSP39_007489 [Pinctada imbricata]|uniref:Ethanolaminephosphotransferase 1 n=1 Tax=Pinctada imbricata TaxID=66713 RepID=A0AA88XPL9_PINIB|nr:hypothetical protein FSP39_007489 [Pinctada imbricata]